MTKRRGLGGTATSLGGFVHGKEAARLAAVPIRQCAKYE